MVAILVVLLAPIIMINLGGLEEPGSTDGKTIYNNYCDNCHGKDGRGNGISANFVDDNARMAKSDDELLTSIREGMVGKIGIMPSWKRTLTEQQVVEVLKYIRTTFQKGAVK